MFEKPSQNHSKIDNSLNNQNFKTSKSNFSKAWKEKRDNMLSSDIMSQIIFYLPLIIIINTAVTREYKIWANFFPGVT